MREMAFRRTGEREPVSGQERGVMNMLIDQRWTGIRSIAKWSSKNGREKVEFHANRVNAELCAFARQKKASTSDQSKNRVAAQKYVECGSE